MSGIRSQRSQRMVGILAALSTGSHRAGTLSTQVLASLLELLPEREICSIETGCGKSTVFFSNLSSRHTSFCYDDRDMENSSVAYVLSHSHFIPSRCTFVFGPTQTTLPAYDFTQGPSIDLALIDGPHGFPFPELEYWHIYPRLALGALLVIDDLMIPSIGRMYDILREDKMFDEVAVFSTTAVLRRSAEPALPPTGDHWWDQAYNFQRFPTSMQPYKREFDYEIESIVRFGERDAVERYCLRGFQFVRARGATTIDSSAVIRFACQADPGKYLRIRLGIQIENPRASQNAAIFVNGDHVADFPSRMREFQVAFSCPVNIGGDYSVELRMPSAKPIHDRKGNLNFQRDCCTVNWFDACVVGNAGLAPEFSNVGVANPALEREIADGDQLGSDDQNLTRAEFLSTLERLGRFVEDAGSLGHVREIVPPPVLCPDDTSPVRFLPLTGTKLNKQATGLGPMFLDGKRSWTFVDFFAFEDSDFAYAVFRSLLLRIPKHKEIQIARSGKVLDKMLLLLEADYKARKLSRMGRLVDCGPARVLFVLWRRCNPAGRAARLLKRMIERYALRHHGRQERRLTERRLLLSALNALAGKQG